MASVLLTFAVKEESLPFQKVIGSHSHLRILLTGIGQRNAEKTIRKALAEQLPEFVLTCGFAGGLNPELTTGTVVFSVDESIVFTAKPTPTPPREGSQSSDARGQFPSREASGVGLKPGTTAGQLALPSNALLAAGARTARFHCAERVVTTVEEKRALWRDTGADAVEMESGVIRAICREHNIPSATVRVISDGANQDLPLDFNGLLDANQNLSYARLAAALLRSPGKIRALLILQKQTQAAAEKLAEVLVKAISNPAQAQS